MFKNKIAKNALWIIACKLVQSGLSLIIGMITARYLGPSNFGLINYASSIVAFVAPVMYLGLNSTLVHEVMNNPEKEGEVLGSSIALSITSALLCIAGLVAFVSVVNAGETETRLVCFLYSFLLLFQAVDLIQYWFQAKYMSKYTSLTMLSAYILISAYKIFLLITKKSIYWFAVSNALDYAIIAAILLVIYNKKGGQTLRFSWGRAGRLLSKSRYYIVSSMMVTIFAQTDKIMIKNMLGNEAAGYYAAAVASASVTSFVFAAIIDSFRPAVFKSASENNGMLELNVTRLYSIIIYASLLQSLLMTVFADLVIGILYGQAYISAVPALRLIVWYTTFSYIGSVRNVWILANELQKYLWIINLSGAVVNVILNFILIPNMGIMGAALASLITQVFTNVIVGYIIKPIRKNNALMLKALNVSVIFKMLKRR